MDTPPPYVPLGASTLSPRGPETASVRLAALSYISEAPVYVSTLFLTQFPFSSSSPQSLPSPYLTFSFSVHLLPPPLHLPNTVPHRLVLLLSHLRLQIKALHICRLTQSHPRRSLDIGVTSPGGYQRTSSLRRTPAKNRVRELREIRQYDRGSRFSWGSSRESKGKGAERERVRGFGK